MWLHLDKEKLYPVLEKDYTQKLWIKNILMLLLIDGGAVVAFVFRKKVLTLPIELLQNRKLIMNLAKNDFKTKYAGHILESYGRLYSQSLRFWYIGLSFLLV